MRGGVVLIAGASGSGKTTLAERVAEVLDAVLLQTDDYYRPLDHLAYEERCAVNFDAPESVDGALLCRQTHSLLSRETIQRPEYDFCRHTRKSFLSIQPRSAVVVEGLFALSYPTLSRQATLSVFVDTDVETCLDRRIHRDVAERGRTPDEVVWRFRNHVHPMYQRYVAPLRETADIVVSGEGEEGFERVISLCRLTSPV